MQKLRLIERDILATGKIDSPELGELRRHLYADGRIDRTKAEFRVDLRSPWTASADPFPELLLKDSFMSNHRPSNLTATRRALRIDRRAPGRFVVALCQQGDDESLFRVIWQGRVITLGLGLEDFDGRPIDAARWLATKYDVNVVYFVCSRDDADTASTCRKFTRRQPRSASRPMEGTVSDPDFQVPN